MDTKENIIRQRFNSLPPEIKGLLYSPEMSFVIQQVGQKNHLHIDQIDALNTETGQVMLGFRETKDFVNELVEMLNIEKTQAEEVARDIDNMLFEKIREPLKKLQEQGTAATPIPVQPSTPAPVPPAAPTPAAPQPISPPATPTEAHPADLMLTQKTISVPPATPTEPVAPLIPPPASAEPPKPAQYKTDPYREPAE